MDEIQLKEILVDLCNEVEKIKEFLMLHKITGFNADCLTDDKIEETIKRINSLEKIEWKPLLDEFNKLRNIKWGMNENKTNTD